MYFTWWGRGVTYFPASRIWTRLQDGDITETLNQTVARVANAAVTEFGLNIKSPPAPLIGAKGDGVTDDTAAIQKMFDNITSNTSIFIPDGTYIVSGLKIFNKSHINIVSHGAIFKLKENSNNDVLLLEQCPYSSISGVNIDGNQNNQSATVNGLSFKATYFSLILNCRVVNCKNDGITIVGYYDNVDSNLFRGNDEVHIDNCFIQSNGRYGIYVDSVADLNIETSNIEFNGSHGIEITNATDIPSGNITISNNQLLSNDGHGIEVTEGSSRLIIDNNHIRNNGKSGIRYVGGKQFLITNNNIHLNGRINVYSAGILLGYNGRGLVSQNIITCTDFSPTQGYGIEAYSVNGLRITTNIIEDNLSTGVSLDADCSNAVLRDNIGLIDSP
ncbi:right-handed parallel beta-helix repeat-containing protein [Paenibacillus sp. HB172176]|uniref:right-handed parallel beta-helix repeat-containing protein n=1 Tax=Paenibacillus sp. HB172176 TaxID=2493690 RepID=UPI00143AC200|nr:right-handed parallel beta-helix repeat-containing protein [Paenibacillus sp. HB172176]